MPGGTGDGLGRWLLMGAGKERPREEGKKNRKKETLGVPTGVREERAACCITRPLSLRLASCQLCQDKG